ncbi:MAG: helix-turn-helix transcriptional regulator [Bacilli bacterium]|nr:helix-turn-helix transcriptional regulator [Bacilli bacterium]
MNIEQLTTKEIGNNIKSIRERKKLSVKETAAALGLSLKTYYNYEHGVREPGLNTLIKIANFFCCSLDDLVSNSFGGKIDSTISFEAFKKENGKIKRHARSKVTTLLDNVIVVHEGLNILTFLRSDTLVSGETMLFRFKNKYYIGKIYERGETVYFDNNGELVLVKKSEKEDLLIFGLYQGKLEQRFQVEGFF